VVKGCRAKSCEEIEQRVYNEVRGFAARTHQFDDFTLMIIKRLE
jgi:serine phosphatase RsbU (regulator of sigma subunit)